MAENMLPTKECSVNSLHIGYAAEERKTQDGHNLRSEKERCSSSSFSEVFSTFLFLPLLSISNLLAVSNLHQH
jgi:hypothetical protein